MVNGSIYLPASSILLLITPQSVIKAAFNDPETLRMAPYRIYRAIIPTKELVSNDKSKSLLALTKGSFAMFPHGDRTLSWFEGRECVYFEISMNTNS